MVFSEFEKGFVLLALLAIGLLSILVFYPTGPTSFEQDQIKKFASCDELKDFVKASSEISYYGYGIEQMIAPAAMKEGIAEEAGRPAESEDYSTTNIQVEGVDEADIVKNDGKYIYAVSGKKIVIVDAYPADNAKILSEIELGGTPREIFINGNKLVVFGDDSSYSGYYREYYSYSQNTFIKVYDISDRENPVLKRDLSVNGSYFDSRMIGDYVYVIVNQPIYVGDVIPLPAVASGSEVKSVCNCPDIYYFDVPDYSKRFTTIMAINTQNDNEETTGKVFVTGETQNIYVSINNIYITYMKQVSQYDFIERIIDEVFLPFVPSDVKNRIIEIKNYNISSYSKYQEISNVIQNYLNSLSTAEREDIEKKIQEKMIIIQEEIAKQMERTVVHKISIDNGKIEYKTQGYAPGRVLNQFSMDEYNGYFRIATTTGNVARISGEASSKNHVYVLDSELNIVGKLEDLAPGEQIYSARFIRDRCYLVTFRKIDPLFVIDLKDPNNPTILGKLKIPGYSDYLHPYDENHIIGIGKETVEAEEGDFSWYQGVKLSLFDVSDVENPKEVSKYEIGDRGTDSYALSDHKAFLFSKAKNLLVMPILLAEIDEEQYPSGVTPSTHGDYVWQGAYVFNLDLDNGFVLKGRVTHIEGDELEKSGYYFYSPYSVKRSLYIDGVLYTLSDKIIKMNSLNDISEINKVNLPYEEEEIYSIYKSI